ncbi:amino acid deaminase [Longispora sp. NPDC051575]|uniref:amino acid deaminase n=1 Tax=Longispora sp. NPDC051575 TaxID=3154943 RepID=UPI00343C4F34
MAARRGGYVATGQTEVVAVIDGPAVDRLRDERLDWRFKAVPADAWGATVGEYLATKPARGDLGTPLLTLDADALDHNVSTMADWCARSGLAHAPHGKTTMAPALWRKQLDAGAWGITLANAAQVRVGRAFGVRRIMLANALVDPGALRWLGAQLDADPGFEFVSWVDSTRTVDLMTEALRGVGRPVDVCVELGAPGGRTGCRDDDEAVAVARAVRQSPALRLVGAAGYEGALAHDTSPEGLAAVDTYLKRLGRFAGAIDAGLVSAGGSAYFDQVGDILGPLVATGATVLLRSGAYITHDDLFLQGVSPLTRRGGAAFRPAARGWARVVSRPEPGLALLDGGKRDFPYDEGLPVPLDLPGAHVSALNDQHSFLRLPAGAALAVGDVVRLGLSHPCTMFDKWTLIPVLDAEDTVVDLVRTYF